MTFINQLFARIQTREEGQTMAEYGIVLAVITLAAVAAYGLLGDAVDNTVRQVLTFFG